MFSYSANEYKLNMKSENTYIYFNRCRKAFDKNASALFYYKNAQLPGKSREVAESDKKAPIKIP